MAKDVVEQIKSHLDIIAVVSEHLHLSRKGKSYWGLCPFHEEKEPSFQVDPGRQVFKCFGCNEGGDVISFLMKVKGLSFAETLEELSEQTGIPLERGPRRERKSEKKAFYEAGRHALEFYVRMLFSVEGQTALAYLKDRGLKIETIQEFSIGYAPDAWDALLNHLRQKGVSQENAYKCGLVIDKKSGGHYDRFRDRVMFPIRDLSGEVIAFGGRCIGSGEPKYINSPESPVFEKRKVLYNLEHAKGMIRGSGAVIVEGYMDVISLHNAGYMGAVATLGTALGEDHIRFLRRFTDNITLVFDGDEAGRKAMFRALEPFLNASVIPKVVILPAGMDPDDMARKDIQAWNDLISQARSIWDFIFNESFSSKDPSKFENQSTILRDLAPMIARVKDATIRDVLSEGLAVRLKVSPDMVARHVRSRGEKDIVSQAQAKDYTEIDLVRLMLFDNHAISMVKELKLAHAFQQKDISQLVQYLVEHGNCVLEDMRCPDAIRMTASRFISLGPYEGDTKKALIDTASKLLSISCDKEIQRIQHEIDQAEAEHDREKRRKLLHERMALLVAKRKIPNGVVEALEGK